MDQDIDGLQRNGPARHDVATAPEAGAATERKKEYFSVRLTFSGSSHEFEDPRLAGEAFFRADPAERPTVTHVDGNKLTIAFDKAGEKRVVDSFVERV